METERIALSQEERDRLRVLRELALFLMASAEFCAWSIPPKSMQPSPGLFRKRDSTTGKRRLGSAGK
jgi:hypothetical protein